MKKVFFVILTFLFLMMVSCKGTPKPEDDTPQDLSELTEEEAEDENEDENEITNNLEDAFTEEQPAEIADMDLEEDESWIEDEVEELAEAETEQLIEPEQLPELPEVVEITEVDTVDAAETDQVDNTEEEPEVAVAREQPPPSRQPPLPPPALLGPAEEKPKTPAEKKPEAEEQKPPAPAKDDSKKSSSETEPPAVSAVRDTPSPLWTELLPQNDEIIYSRVVRCTVGQIVEIPFRGTGWVFLGELASRRGIVYGSRRLDTEGQTFIFTVEEAGTYSLKFYKQDFIRDFIINDYVQVIAGESSAASGSGWFNPPFDRGRVTAEPRWPTALEEAEILKRASSGPRPNSAPPVYTPSESSPAKEAASPQEEAPSREAPSSSHAAEKPPAAEPPPDSQERSQESEQSPAADNTVTDGKPADKADAETIEKLPPQEMIKKAKELFDGGNTSAAIAILDKFREFYPEGSDELYWLYGQFYEANTPSRDILLSLDYYRRIINEYPQSLRYNDARRRIAYLERFYINIQ